MYRIIDHYQVELRLLDLRGLNKFSPERAALPLLRTTRLMGAPRAMLSCSIFCFALSRSRAGRLMPSVFEKKGLSQ